MRILPRRRVEITLKDITSAYKTSQHLDNPVSEFEKCFSDFIGVKYALALPSERLGLSIFLDMMTFEKNDEVVMSAYNYHVVAALFKHKGLKPVFVDIDSNTRNIDSSLIEEKVTPKTKFLIATHLFGKSCPMEEITNICTKHNITLIEDAAHACGGEYKGKKVGSFGDVAFFSFGTGKGLVTLGGSMLVTNDEVLYKNFKKELLRCDLTNRKVNFKNIIKPIAETLLTKKFIFDFLVYPVLFILNYIYPQFSDGVTEDKYIFEDGMINAESSNFSKFQASLGLEQLNKLENLNEKRIHYATLLNDLLKDIDQVEAPFIPKNREHTSLYYGIIAERVEELRKYLFVRGVDTKLGSMRACSALDFLESDDSCPIAENLAPNIIELPCYPSLTRKDIYYQINLIRKFYGKEPVIS